MEPGKISVLIVDDEPQICDVIRDELSASNCLCSVCTDFIAAKKLMSCKNFDVLVADFSMPQGSGLELLEFTKKHSLLCKTILVTGKGNRDVLSQAIFLGAYDYIEKPFSEGALAATVTKAANSNRESELAIRAAIAMGRDAETAGALLDSVLALNRAVEAIDPYTRRHSDQVAFYATAIAKEMGISESQIKSIRLASQLHDIGKIAVPDNILTKPGPLTDNEFKYIRRHPALGADIISRIPLYKSEAQLVRSHHERWDGKGYPDGLLEEQTPIGARIIQVADCIDAMLMERTYKKCFSVETMLKELARCAGKQFNPTIAAVAAQWCRSNQYALFLPDKLAVAC